MESTMDVAQLVAQMQETLSTIHTTLASLNTTEHDAKLDELEARRDNTIKHLLAAFSAESHVLRQKRQAQREEIAERRRLEDEERERRRRQEDEEFAERNKQEDEDRDGRLLHETNEVEEETDNLMNEVEQEAQRAIDEGQNKLMDLEEKRKELNRLIEEQLRVPIIPKRSRRGSTMPPAVATQSKPPEPAGPESLDNASEKALEPRETSADEHDGATEIASQAQTMPQADMVEEHALNTDASDQKQSSPSTDSRPTSRQDRPLFVHPVISRTGTIIHTDQLQQKVPASVEPIGIPTHNTDSPDVPDSPKPDVTWWENKRREEAERVLRHQTTPSPLSFNDNGGEATTSPQLSAAPETKDAGLIIPSTETPSSVASPQVTPDVVHQVLEHEEEAQPAEEVAATPQLSPDVDTTLSDETSRGMSHTSDEIMAVAAEPVSIAFDSASGYDLPTSDHHIEAPAQAERAIPPQNLDVLKNDLAPEDIPLPMIATGNTFDSAGDTSFESAHEQHNALHFALSNDSRLHSGEHVSFVGDEEHDISHDISFGPIEASGTPEHQDPGLSTNDDDASPASSYQDQPDTESPTTPNERPEGALPPDMESSCSLTDRSEYRQPEEHSEINHSHRPPLLHSESSTDDEGDDVEQVIPLERVPSRQPPRETFSGEESEDAQGDETEQDHEEDDLHNPPALRTIPEHEVLKDITEDIGGPEPEQQGVVGLGIQNDTNADVSTTEQDAHYGSDVGHEEDVPALSSCSGHGDQDHSYYDEDSHLDDEYPHHEPATPNPLLLQLFPTSDSGGDHGSPVHDEDVPELLYGVGRHGEGDAGPGVGGGGGQLGDHADREVLREHGLVGEGGAEGAEEETQELLVREGDNALPSAGLKTEESLADQLRRASQVSNQSVEMEAGYTTTVNGEDELFDDEDAESGSISEVEGAESEGVSEIEDAYLNEESVVDAVVAAMGPEPEGEVPDKVAAHGNGEVTDEAPAEMPAGAGSPADAPVDPGPDAQAEPTVEMPEQMAAEIETEARTQVPDDTPYATPLEMPAPVEVQTEMQAEVQSAMEIPRRVPVVSATVPAIETPEQDHAGRSPNWVDEADDYFDEQDDERQRVETPRHHSFEQQGANINTTAVTSDSRQGTPSSTASQGLSASRHNPDRPQTPDQDTELAHQENPPTPLHGHQEHHSSPQSVRSQSTIDSAPPSPDHHTVTDIHNPVIRGLVSTQSPSYQTGRPRNDSHLTEYGHHRDESEDTPFAKWQRRESTLSIPDQPPIAPLNTNRNSKHSRAGSVESGEKGGGGGSLFQRMRSVFEQQTHASDINTSSRPTSSTSATSHSNNDRHGEGGGGGGGSGLWGSGGPLSGRFGKSWSSSLSNDHHHHRDYHHPPYTGYSPVHGSEVDPDVADDGSGLLGGREDLH